jgi:hypothetical protein
MAESNLTQLGYVEETVFGTTPASALQILRTTGGAITPTQETVVSEEIRADLRAGRPVRTSQMAQGDINLEWSYGTFDSILEGMMMEDWASDVLVDGTTKKSYTFEDQFLGLDTPLYNTFTGARISNLSMDLATGAIVSGSFGIMAATPDLGNSTSAGTGAATAATTTGPWNTVDMVEELTEATSGSTPAALAKVTGVTINIERSLRAKQAIGAINPFDIGVGRLLVSGSITQYFEDAALIAAWEAFSDRLLRVEFQDEAGNFMLIEIPKLKYTGDLNVENPGVDADRMVTANFEAYATATDAALIRFTRTAA